MGRKRKWRKGKAEEVKLVSGELCPHRELSLSGSHPAGSQRLTQPIPDTCNLSTFFFFFKSPPVLKDLGTKEFLQSHSRPAPWSFTQKPRVTSAGDFGAQLSRKTLSYTFLEKKLRKKGTSCYTGKGSVQEGGFLETAGCQLSVRH